MIVVCWFCFAMGHSGDGCLSSSILLKYECRGGIFVCDEAVLCYDGLLWGVLFSE